MKAPLTSLLSSLLLVAAFAGCLGGEDGKETGESSSESPSASSSESPPETSEGPQPSEEANGAPVLDVRILMNGTAADLDDNGSYLLRAGENITFDASGTSDPDGDDLTFSWSFGDNATSANASEVHRYKKHGNYTVLVKVSDGELGDEKELSLVLGRPLKIRTDAKDFDGSLVVGTQPPAGVNNPCGDLGEEDVDVKTFDWVFVDEETDGAKSYVGRVLLVLDSSGDGAMDVDIQLLDPAGTKIGAGETASEDERMELLDVELGPGTYKVKVLACNLAAIDFTVDASADYFPA